MANTKKEITSPVLDNAQEDRILEKLPGDLKFFDTVHDRNDHEIIDLAEGLFKDLRKKLGSNTSKPRMKAVEDMFYKYADKPRKVPKAVEEAMRRSENIEKIAVLDQTYDQSVATALNKFDKISVESGSMVQEAYDKWTLAVRIFQSESRGAGAVLKAKIDQAHADYKDLMASSGSLGASDIRLSEEARYFKRASTISQGLVVHETSMSKANQALAIAFGDLIKDMFGSVSNTCLGEAKLIDSTQTASLGFWSNVQKELSKSGTRT